MSVIEIEWPKCIRYDVKCRLQNKAMLLEITLEQYFEGNKFKVKCYALFEERYPHPVTTPDCLLGIIVSVFMRVRCS